MFIRLLVGCLLCCVFTASAVTQKTLTLKIGPMFPSVLLDREKSMAWNATVEGGAVIDNIVGLGMSFDFTWNTLTKEYKDSTDLYHTTKKEAYFYFPASFFITIDPLYYWVIHPVAQLNIGFSPLIYYKDTLALDTTVTPHENKLISTKPNGFYYGAMVRLSLTGMYDISEHISAQLGISYLWAEPHRSDDDNRNYKRLLSGVGFASGFRFRF